jgi:hypothetical protein
MRARWRAVHIISLLGLFSALVYIALPLYDLYMVASEQVEPRTFSFTFREVAFLVCFVGLMLSMRSKALQSLAS